MYKISCTSNCGTYFQPYLQSVTVIADTKEEAIELAKKWMDEEDQHFIRKDESTWEVELLVSKTDKGVIDFHRDSDY